jgi:Sec-independent protein translocase protein TatA
LEALVKSREPSNDKSETSASHSRLRALGRAVGGSIDAIRSKVSTKNQTSGDISKQRLSAVLWNDRTVRAAQETNARSAHDAQLTSSAGDHASPVAEAASSAAEAAARALEAAAVLYAAAQGDPRARIDTPRPSDAMRARIEATNARVAAKAPAMPKGIAPSLKAAELVDHEGSVELLDPSELLDQDTLASLQPPRATPPPPPKPQRAARSGPPPLPPTSAAPAAGAEPSRSEPPPPPARAAAPPPAAAPPSRPAPPAALDEEEHDEDEEPICTRSMARLLAGQGHRTRALRIYDALLAANGSDESLRAEAEALRRAG